MKKYQNFLLLLLLIPISVNAATINYVVCGNASDIPAALPVLSSNLINAVKIAVPIILIIMGMLDFAKSTTANDEKAMSESKTKFIKRAIAAVVVFLVVAVVQLAFSALGGETSGNITSCMNCFLNNNCTPGATYDSNGNCAGCGCFKDETTCGEHSTNCDWINNTCVSSSSSTMIKICADHEEITECNGDTENNCGWDYSKGCVVKRECYDYTGTGTCPATDDKGNSCTGKGTYASPCTISTAKKCGDYGTASECASDSNCKWDSGSRFCETKSSSSTNNNSSEYKCYYCTPSGETSYHRWATTSPNTNNCVVDDYFSDSEDLCLHG